MPIHIPIYVNEKLIKTYHIGRLEGNATPDSVNEYVINKDDEFWSAGTKFTHRYGDGIDICIIKGIQAIDKELG